MSKALKSIIGIIVAAAVVAGGGYYYLYVYSAQSAGSTLSNYTFTRLTTGEIDTTVSATGTVRTAQNATLTWSDSGVVGKVNVKVGDQVKANDILATLDPANLPNDIIQAQQALVVDTQALADLQSNKSNLPTLQKAVIDYQTAVTNAQTARDNLNFPHGTPEQIAAAQAALTLANQKLAMDKSNYDKISGDPTTNAHKASAYAAYLNSVAAQTSAQNNLAWISSPPSASDIATADNTLAVAKAQLADAQRAVSEAGSGVDPTTLAADQAKIAADQSIIDEQNLRAPFSGTISTATVQPGDIVANGTSAFRIDDTSKYYIDLAVSEIDISNVAVGQAVTFTFDAVPNKTYNGVVTYVSQVGTTTSNVVNFTVTTQVTDADALVKPGITSSGSIITNSVKNVLVVPSKAVKVINGKTVVYVVTFTGANGAPITFGGGAGTTGGSGTTGGAGRAGTGAGANTTPAPGTSRNGSGGGTGTTGGAGRAGTGTTTTPASGATAPVEKISEVQVTVGASNDTLTQVSSSALQAGALIVTNPPSTGIATPAARGGLFGGILGGGGIRVRSGG